MKIDYKSRSLVVSETLTNDGQSKVAIMYDLFDRAFYQINADGDMKTLEGLQYIPSPLPNSNNITNITIEGTVAVITFANNIKNNGSTSVKIDNGAIINSTLVSNNNQLIISLSNLVDGETYTITTQTENLAGEIVTNSVPFVYVEDVVITINVPEPYFVDLLTGWFVDGEQGITILPSQYLEEEMPDGWSLNRGDVIDSIVISTYGTETFKAQASLFSVNLEQAPLTPSFGELVDSNPNLFPIEDVEVQLIESGEEVIEGATVIYNLWKLKLGGTINSRTFKEGDTGFVIRIKLYDYEGDSSNIISRSITKYYEDFGNMEIFTSQGTWQNSDDYGITWIGLVKA